MLACQLEVEHVTIFPVFSAWNYFLLNQVFFTFLWSLTCFFSPSVIFTEKIVFIYKEFYCLFQKVSGFMPTIPKFPMVLLTTIHNESNVKIINVGGVTHIRTLARFYIYKQSLKTPPHFAYPPFLKSMLLFVIWRFLSWGKSIYSKYEVFIEKIPLKSVTNIFFRNILIKNELI